MQDEEERVEPKKKKKNQLPVNSNFFIVITTKVDMIQAEISLYPIGTNNTSGSFYIAKAIETIQNMEGIRYEINSMGTVLESQSIEKIYEASKKMMEAVHNLGVNRVEVILKIDSRKDKQGTMEQKLESIKKHLNMN